MVGERFGRLTVIARVPPPAYLKDRYKKYLLCKCDCGKEKTMYYYDVKSGKTRSCGCLLVESCRANGLKSKRYSPEKSRLKRIWSGMKARCTDAKIEHYRDYGGRGITICKEWLEFEKFYNWAIINGYTNTLTLDRENVNGNYEPANCRFITMKLQQNNRRNNVFLEIDKKIMTATQWAEEYNIPSATLLWRVKHGWDSSEFFIEPKLSNKWRNYIAK